MDFGLLPPEVNSGRMYAGTGPAPMLAAATAWEGLAAELPSMAAAYESALAELTADWQGASSATMTAAATPYVTWIRSTAAQTEQAAAQGRAAAAAYEAAFAATVPPPMIVANRNLLTTLIATNILGQNTPAIAATEAYYATMWAQDATAMYCYAGSSAAATRLIPFTRPPQTAEPVGTTGQSAAVTQATGNSINSNVQTQLLSLVPKTLRHLTTTVTAPSAAASSTSGAESILSGITTFMSQLTGPYSPLGQVGVSGGWWLSFGQILGLSQNVPGVASLLGPPTPVTGVLGPLSGGYMSAPALAPAGLGGGAVSGAMSRAGLVGALSVPPAWASAVPTVKTVAAVLSSTGLGAAPAIVADGQAGLLSSQMALSSMAGRAIGASAAQSIGGLATRTIGATAVCAIGTEAAEDLAGTVTILVIPPVE